MAGSSRHDSDDAARWDVAREIAIEAGVLDYCDRHDATFRTSVAIWAAFQLARGLFAEGAFAGLFTSRSELDDLLQQLLDQHTDTRCPACARGL